MGSFLFRRYGLGRLLTRSKVVARGNFDTVFFISAYLLAGFHDLRMDNIRSFLLCRRLLAMVRLVNGHCRNCSQSHTSPACLHRRCPRQRFWFLKLVRERKRCEEIGLILTASLLGLLDLRCCRLRCRAAFWPKKRSDVRHCFGPNCASRAIKRCSRRVLGPVLYSQFNSYWRSETVVGPGTVAVA